MKFYGFTDGDGCNRHGCKGVIKLAPPDNCSCHLGCAPCTACSAPRHYCSVCDWAEEFDEDWADLYDENRISPVESESSTNQDSDWWDKVMEGF